MDGRIFNLKKELQKSLQYQWTVKEMADFVEVSVPHFQKLFKENTGIPPIAYLRDLRLEKARELLESEDKFYRINEIRDKVGMLQDSHFTRDFKKKYGAAPIKYRKLHWEKKQAEDYIGKK